jgi:hypothetical protein
VHDARRDVERLQVLNQGTGVRLVNKPLAKARGVIDWLAGVWVAWQNKTILVRKLQDCLGAQAPIQVVVE